MPWVCGPAGAEGHRGPAPACLLGTVALAVVLAAGPALAMPRGAVLGPDRLARRGGWAWLPRAPRVGPPRTLEDERALVWHARGALHAGQWEEAMLAYAAVPFPSPYHPEALEALAWLHVRTGRPARARADLEALLPTVDGARAEAVRAELARLCLAAGDPAATLQVLRPTLEAPRGSGATEGHAAALVEAMWLSGLAAKATGHAAFALGRFQDVARLAPASQRAGLAQLEVVNHHLRMGRPGQAADSLARYVAGGYAEIPGVNLPATLAFLRGEAAAREEDWARASAAWEQAASDRPLRDHALVGRAWALWRLRRTDEALGVIGVYRREGWAGLLQAPARYLEGRLLQDAGRLAEADARYQEVEPLGVAAWSEQALFQRAGLALRGGQTGEALALAATIVRDHPGGRMASAALWLLAEAQLSQGRTAEAIVNYQRLASRSDALMLLGGKGAAVVFKLGLAFLRAGDDAAAEAAFAKVGEPAMRAEALFWQAEAASRRERHGEAARLYQDLLRDHPESPRVPDAWYGLAWARLDMDEAGPAAAAFEEASRRLTDGRRRRDARYHLGLLLLDAGRPRAARVLLAEIAAGSDASRGAEAAWWLAEAMADEGDWVAAAAQYGACVAIGGERGRQARRQQAEMLQKAERWAEAAAALDALLEDPDADVAAGRRERLAAAVAWSRAGVPDRAAVHYARLASEARGLPEEQDQLWKPLIEAQIATGAWAGAGSLLTGVASASPWADGLLRQVARGHAASGQWRAAAATWASLPVQDAASRMARVEALEQSGDRMGAAECLEEILLQQTDARDPFWERLCRNYATLDLPERERTTLDRWMAEASADMAVRAAAWMAYGERMVRRQDLDEAAFALRAAVRGLPVGDAHWKARYWLASTLVTQGRLEDAEVILKPLADGAWPRDVSSGLSAWRAQARLLRGQVLETRKDWDGAERLYTTLAGEKLAPAAQRREAEARLAFIRQFVRRPAKGKR
ncbi:MAG: tetratricopeptide repeat protein [Candidatus Sericytochromatia bacterium]|nr:tetratricopeptide repeat protein [Candidatus Sericytochromatia bacterium]